MHLSACACFWCRGWALMYHCLPYTFETDLPVNLEPPFLSKADQSRSPRDPPVSVYSSLWPLYRFGGSGLRSPHLHSRHYYSRNHLPKPSLFQCWGLNLGSHAQWAFPVALSHTSYENIVFEHANLSPETLGKSISGVGGGTD